MTTATQVLVNESHGDKAFHVLAKSGNLYIELDKMIPLSQWLRTRADMPDSVEEVFNPDVEPEWAENIQCVCSPEALYCLFNGIYWRVFVGENGQIMGYHPKAECIKVDGVDHWVLVDQVEPIIVTHHRKESLEVNQSSLGDLEEEMEVRFLSGIQYEQERDYLRLLIASKK